MRTTIDLPDDLIAQLRAIASSTGMKLSTVVERFVRNGVENGVTVRIGGADSHASAQNGATKSTSGVAATQSGAKPQQPDRGRHAPLRHGCTLWEGESVAEGFFVCCEKCGTTLPPEKHDGMRHTVNCPAAEL